MRIAGLIAVLLWAVLPQCTADEIDLSGRWQFALDPDRRLTAASALTDVMMLPGTTDTNQRGNYQPAGTETTHLTRPYTYKGRAWYSREVTIPKAWRRQTLHLFLERTKTTEVYVDGRLVGGSNDVSTPQEFTLGRLKPGSHLLTVMVDNGSGVPEQVYGSSHAYTEDTQTNWNGIIGRMSIGTAPHIIPQTSPQSPLKVEGHHFVQNGKKVFLRGRHDACVWPLTGHVAMDVESWRHYMKVCADYGLNHVRFHSWCPPEVAFVAADEAGIILQPELPFWGDFNEKDTLLMDFLLKEGENILRWYGHHPSFRMFALGNELWGSIGKMEAFVEHFRQLAPDKLYTFGSNYYLGYQGVKPGMDYFTTCRVGGEAWGSYNTHTRGSFSFADAFDGGLINHNRPNAKDNFEAGCSLSAVPVISHETAQFQSYPDYAEIGKYRGVLRPDNLEVFRKRLAEAGMADLSVDFHRASGRWAMLLYKQDIEMDLRTANMAGFQLLDLQDYPGQGSAYVGVLDAFLDSKGFITPEEWRQFCSPVVPLVVLDQYCFQAGDALKGRVQVANYGGESLRGKTVRLSMGSPFGWHDTRSIDTDEQGLLDLGAFCFDEMALEQPVATTLTLSIVGTPWRNSWQIWVYPQEQQLEKEGIVIARQLSDELCQKLEQGSSVLLMPDSSALTVGGLFTTDYWNYRMFKTISENNHKPVSPGTLGILCNPAHALFRDFPTEEHTNWQWYPVIRHSHPFILDGLSRETDYRPVVQVIDNIERNHRLGLVFEFQVGRGRLLVVMSDLEKAAHYPEGRQFYRSVLRYMHSADFAPTTQLTAAQLKSLFTTQVGEVQLEELNNISPY